jgi:hypothetical protein
VGVFDQHRRGETRRLVPVEDGGGDVGGEAGKAGNLAVVGWVQLFALGQIGELPGSTVQQLFAKAVGFSNHPT